MMCLQQELKEVGDQIVFQQQDEFGCFNLIKKKSLKKVIITSLIWMQPSFCYKKLYPIKVAIIHFKKLLEIITAQNAVKRDFVVIPLG